MEVAHKRQRELVDTIVGDKEEAARKRRRAQAGVAAAGRCGQSIQAARARKAGLDMKVINKDADDALKAGSGLVQASLEHLDEAERSWDKFVAESGMKIKSYPTEKQVVMYMSAMSSTRQRECLAQRGKRRKGRQNTVVRNYVAEMGNNLWSTKYPAFAKLDAVRRKDYWSKIFKAYKSLYAKASAEPETEVDEERAEQLWWRRPRKCTSATTSTARRCSSCRTCASVRRRISTGRWCCTARLASSKARRRALACSRRRDTMRKQRGGQRSTRCV